MMQRPARVVTIGAAAMFCGITYFFTGSFSFHTENPAFTYFESVSIFTLPVAFVSVMSNITAIQRLNHVRRELDKKEK
ncbi:MAG: hypothetical protein JKX68_10120 [Flavobacteriales bacterium]|nr:hypothetical protein [Flavobacteriales bacterium]